MKKMMQVIVQYYTFLFFILTILFVLCLFSLRYYSLIEAYVLGYLVINVGLRGIIASIANICPFSANMIAEQYHWPADCSLQRDVAASEGAFGAMGILCIWFGKDFWLATLIGYIISWIISESIGIVKVARRYLNKSEPEKSIPIQLFLGMCLDWFLAIFSFCIFMFKVYS